MVRRVVRVQDSTDLPPFRTDSPGRRQSSRCVRARFVVIDRHRVQCGPGAELDWRELRMTQRRPSRSLGCPALWGVPISGVSWWCRSGWKLGRRQAQVVCDTGFRPNRWVRVEMVKGLGPRSGLKRFHSEGLRAARFSVGSHLERVETKLTGGCFSKRPAGRGHRETPADVDEFRAS